MTTIYYDELIKIINEVKEMLVRKNADYGVDNLKRHGIFGIIVRLDDKLARLNNLYHAITPNVKDESMRDTIRDIAGYAIQALLLMDGKL